MTTVARAWIMCIADRFDAGCSQSPFLVATP
jgi:hypothetical protein